MGSKKRRNRSSKSKTEADESKTSDTASETMQSSGSQPFANDAVASNQAGAFANDPALVENSIQSPIATGLTGEPVIAAPEYVPQTSPEEFNIQRALEGTGTTQDEVPDVVLDVLGTGGQKLEYPIQRALEEKMDADFSNVRIHTGAKAAQAAEAIDAKAFTCGNDVVFNAGEYDPESPEGQYLLAHELAHVKQQTGGAIQRLPKSVSVDGLKDDDKEITALIEHSIDTTGLTEEEYEWLCAKARDELDELRAEADGQAEFNEICAAVRSELVQAKSELEADDCEKTHDKPYANSRPSYAPGQVEQVWENAKEDDGNVYDPHTDEKLEWDRNKSRRGQWDMGHKPGEEYWELHELYMEGIISKEEFLAEYRNPENYRPEDPSENRSRRHQQKRKYE